MKTFTATWDTQDIDDIIVSAADDWEMALREEIDNEIMVEMMRVQGWFVVVLEDGFKNMKHPIDIETWCNETIGESKKIWSNFGPSYLFKESKHAEWFMLRWL